MTSFTSDNAREACPSATTLPGAALVYAIAAVACALFGAVYEAFSHGVYSYFMIYAFAFPLVLGVVPCLVMMRCGACAPGRIATNAWNSGVATLAVGSLLIGALEIYGTTNRLVVVYPVVGLALLVAGLVRYVADVRKRGQRRLFEDLY